ncbi:hypothetical protein BVRB_5g125690 [Beta vulgaris subsp. vulgaris]|uniref:Uncharacterized protein n=1 Tax=Beta vulgaris subsp. vulgaris TaxID=3555 RepID=A0A0J8E3C7_BETVV|nr:hypothetical protein BVRB_5g125690 [Beta vulgaris subsp. vulgaris]
MLLLLLLRRLLQSLCRCNLHRWYDHDDDQNHLNVV